MDWQQLTSLAIVGATFLLLARSLMRKRKQMMGKACGQDCHCSPRIATEKQRK